MKAEKPLVLRTDAGMEVLKTQLHELEKIATVITAPSDDEETLIEMIGEGISNDIGILLNLFNFSNMDLYKKLSLRRRRRYCISELSISTGNYTTTAFMSGVRTKESTKLPHCFQN